MGMLCWYLVVNQIIGKKINFLLMTRGVDLTS